MYFPILFINSSFTLHGNKIRSKILTYLEQHLIHKSITMNNQIKNYYDKLADKYDDDRFGNSYGQYLDIQEKRILETWLSDSEGQYVLDLGCGTGRFLEFANVGLDISPKMLKIAQQKFPNKELVIGSANEIPFKEATFDTIISFHVLMHLDLSMVKEIFAEVHRTLKKNGQFIVDVPSKYRRNLTNYKAKNWHGKNDLTIEDLQKLIGNQWKIVQYQGIAFFPIHRIPKSLRLSFIWLDNLLCRSPFRKYASYLVFEFVKI